MLCNSSFGCCNLVYLDERLKLYADGKDKKANRRKSRESNGTRRFIVAEEALMLLEQANAWLSVSSFTQIVRTWFGRQTEQFLNTPATVLVSSMSRSATRDSFNRQQIRSSAGSARRNTWPTTPSVGWSKAVGSILGGVHCFWERCQSVGRGRGSEEAAMRTPRAPARTDDVSSTPIANDGGLLLEDSMSHVLRRRRSARGDPARRL